MNYKTIVVVALALVALQLASAHPVKRSCACNLKGTEVCGCVPAPAPRPVRPRAPASGFQRVVYQKFAPTELKAQDVCTCQGGLVTAPEIPRVACKLHSGPARQAPNYAFEQGYGGDAGDCGDAAPNPCEEYPAPAPVKTYVIPAEEQNEEIIEEIPAPAPARVPADAVSLALAYAQATRQQKNIPEEQLAFGHMTAPKDGRIITKKRIVPESNLYAVRNQIVELKPSTAFGRSCDEEAEASLLAAQQSCGEEEEATYGAPLPSYRDLGFAPVGGDCKFVPGEYRPSPQVVETVEYNVPAPRIASAPAYSACDALATVERGRGNVGTDYYGANAPALEAEVTQPENCEGSSSYGSRSFGGDEGSSSYGSRSFGGDEGSFGPRHTGRRGCSCGCGY